MRIVLSTLTGILTLFAAGVLGEVDAAGPGPEVERMAPMALNSYGYFPREIGSAPVLDLDGQRVGQVQKLNADLQGKPVAIEVWLRSGRTITVAGSNVSYDEQANVITIGLTDVELGLVAGADRRR